MIKTVTFEKIVGGGKALGYLEGKPCFAAGPLPGEVAEVEIIKDKPGFVEAAVVRIVKPSKMRAAAAEDHYLACSPWQNVEYAYQLELKRAVLADAFGRPELSVPILDMVGADNLLAYRNKLEFSLKPGDARLDLAFHARGSYENLVVLPEGCALGTAAMNTAALRLAEAAHALKLGGYIETLTVRRSVATGNLLGHIALHQVPKRDFSALANAAFSGVVVSRVRRRIDHEVVWHTGDTNLTEDLGGNTFEYPFDGFFQTNVPMFEDILQTMLKAMPRAGRILDIYGGAGSIGIAAAKFSREVVGIEINPASAELAESNAARAKMSNYISVCSPAQRIDPRLLAGADCIVVDPPRAGLELRLVHQILDANPAKIIYLSCNPATQARDVMLLGANYKTAGVTGYDLYPGTLHLESLAVLERI